MPSTPDQPIPALLRCLGRGLGTLILREKLINFTVRPHGAFKGFIYGLDLLLEQLLRLLDHFPEMLPCSGIRLCTGIYDTVQGNRLVKVRGSGSRARFPVGFTIDAGKCAG